MHMCVCVYVCICVRDCVPVVHQNGALLTVNYIISVYWPTVYVV